VVPTRLLLVLPLACVALAACGGDAAPPAAADVSIVASEYHFDPSAVTVPAGPVTFTIRNDGSEEHEFEILQGDDVIDEMEGLVPGLERDLTVDLPAGQYTFVCRLADHEQRGMTGTLTVTG
jgi:iron uptake system component EfeO